MRCFGCTSLTFSGWRTVAKFLKALKIERNLSGSVSSQASWARASADYVVEYHHESCFWIFNCYDKITANSVYWHDILQRKQTTLQTILQLKCSFQCLFCSTDSLQSHLEEIKILLKSCCTLPFLLSLTPRAETFISFDNLSLGLEEETCLEFKWKHLGLPVLCNLSSLFSETFSKRMCSVVFLYWVWETETNFSL